MALADLEQAEFFLNEAFDLVSLKKKEMAALALYNAVFHAGRALLFKDGIREKSHFCLQKYLETHYEKANLLSSADLSLFDLLRGIRLDIQYSVSKPKFEQNLTELYDRTETFVEKSKKLVQKEK